MSVVRAAVPEFAGALAQHDLVLFNLGIIDASFDLLSVDNGPYLCRQILNLNVRPAR